MRQKKFTLTELLVVIGVIMILAMIAFPAISSVRKKMQITKAKSDIASITAALQQVQSIYSNFRNLSSLVDANGMIDTTAHYQTLFEELIEPPASPVFNFRKIRMLDKRKEYIVFLMFKFEIMLIRLNHASSSERWLCER